MCGGNIVTNAQKRGYLNENYKLFHIYDKRSMDFDSHSHDFHKLIICLGGSVNYTIEGKSYVLSPWDILLVPKNMIHHSKTDALRAYERIVLFIDDKYLSSLHGDDALSECFKKAETEGKCLFHAEGDLRKSLASASDELERSSKGGDSYAKILRDASFARLMVHINRLAIDADGKEGVIADQRLDEIISYINANFASDMTIETLAQRFYISRSYLMHKFKTVTGGSVHSYIAQKRLTLALSLLRDGKNAGDVASDCGFSDYTVFYKSFKKMYGLSPTEVYAKNRYQK